VRKLLSTGILLASFALISTAALACGDKLMLNFGSLQFRQVYARHPASVLAYVRQNSAVAGVVTQLELQPVLKQTGHKFYAVDGPARLEEALKTGKYDLVLADAADAESLEHEVQETPLMPSVLPVVYKSTKVEAASVEKKFHAVLKAPGSVEHYLAAIDQAMEVRAKGASTRVAR
jgi:hypothetical protein